MDDTFLKIVRGEIPATKVYEDERVFAFLDIKPNNKGHTLVIPKERYRNVFDMPEDLWCDLARTAQKISHAVKKATNADGVNITMNNEPAAGQVVFHAHIHVIPRYDGDKVYKGARHTSYHGNEMNEVAEAIKAHL